ncbi:protein of unknown function (DUF3425) [Geosmithia morbida]|uniref:Uncharacterized protein n=1 Tax=Geosmithia morbida TaxID=1094350 RepID=A0A9P4YS37_9HYPO|nr:protein of unknown function (DUF3425) [Geosmithia morbida]KAF4119984.1 protein of unknown function (DUF3425) [Geosmithia morbida]
MHDVVNIVELLARRAYIEYCMGMRNIGNLPTLTKINVFRGLFRNAEILGSTAECIAYDAMSSATAYAPTPSGSISLSCPDSLKPTDLQRSTKHNPWIDLFPLPRMRDNCIFAFHGPDPLDNDDLRSDVLEVGLDAPSAADMQLLVWGNPWDPRNWEVSEAFVKKWGMLLRGCDEILQSTNYWRQMRGEKKLAIEYSA